MSVRLYVKFVPRVETHGRVSKNDVYLKIIQK